MIQNKGLTKRFIHPLKIIHFQMRHGRHFLSMEPNRIPHGSIASDPTCSFFKGSSQLTESNTQNGGRLITVQKSEVHPSIKLLQKELTVCHD